jgi:hypothetical protein
MLIASRKELMDKNGTETFFKVLLILLPYFYIEERGCGKFLKSWIE